MHSKRRKTQKGSGKFRCEADPNPVEAELSRFDEKLGLQIAQKDLRAEAREKSTSGGVLSE
jgi:hypothetical protein